jgi:hypothetical protein
MTLHQREISQELGIPRTSFYRAIEKLSQEGLIDWEAPNGLVVCLKPSQKWESVPEMGLQSQKWESVPEMGLQSQKWDSNPKNGTPSPKNGTNTSPKTAFSKDSSPSSDSYQIFIKSLSDNEGEIFLNFVREQVKNLPQPINDLEAWLANENKAGQNRWEVYYQNFQMTQKKEIVPTPQTSLRDEIEQRRRVVLEKYKELQAAAGDEP